MRYMLFVLNKNKCRILFIFTLWLSFQINAYAATNKFDLHGFIAQGLVQHSNNNFVNDDDNISAKLTEIGLNASYQLSDTVRLAGQAVYLNGGNRYPEGARIDYLLVDWSAYSSEHWQTNIYLGRYKNYHWLYSSTRDVPLDRPSIILPQSVYFDGTRDMSVGGDGIALNSKYSSERLGELDVNFSTGTSPLTRENVTSTLGERAKGKLRYDKDFQASLYWQPSLSFWRFGVAFTGADFTYQPETNDAFMPGKLSLERFYINTDYHAEKWSLSAELLQEKLSLMGLFQPLSFRETVGQGGFIQANYKLNKDFKFSLKYERYFADKDDKSGNALNETSFGTIPSYFGYQHDTMLGFSYSLGRACTLKFEHHWYQGTARLTPLISPDPLTNNKKHWQLSAMQFVFWF